MLVKNAERVGALIAEADFSVVSDEIGINIFSYLSAGNLAQAMRVCRNWHRLAQDAMLWRPICLRISGHKEEKLSWYESAKRQAAFILPFFEGEVLCREPMTISAGLKAFRAFSTHPRSTKITELKNDVLVFCSYLNYLHQTTVAVNHLNDMKKDYKFIVIGEILSLARQGNVLAMIVDGEDEGLELQLVDIRNKLVSVYQINSFNELNKKTALWHTTVFNLSWDSFKLFMIVSDEFGNTIFEAWDFSKEKSGEKAEKPKRLSLN